MPLRGTDDNQIWEALSQAEERSVISKRACGTQEFVVEREKACLSPPAGERKNDEAELSFVTPEAERWHREGKNTQKTRSSKSI